MDTNQAETRPAQEGRVEVARRAKSTLESFSKEQGIEKDVNWFESPDGPIRLAEQIANLSPDLQTVMSQIDTELVDGVSIRARKPFSPEEAESATTIDPNRRVIAATFKGEKPKGREPIPDQVLFADNVKYWFDQGASGRKLASLSRMTKAEVVKKIREGLDKWVPFSEKLKGPVGKAIRAGAVAAMVTSASLIDDQIRPPQSTVEDGAAATQVIPGGMEQRYAEAGLVGGTPGGTDDEQYVRPGGSGSDGKGTEGEGSESTPGPTPPPETARASTEDNFGQTRESIRNGREAVYNQLMDGIVNGVDKEHRFSLQIGEKDVYQGRMVIFPEPVIDQDGKKVIIALARDGVKSFSPTTIASDPNNPTIISESIFENFVKRNMNDLKQNGKNFIPYGEASLSEDPYGRIVAFHLKDPSDPERSYDFNLDSDPPIERTEKAIEESQKAAGLGEVQTGKEIIYNALKPLLNPQQPLTSPSQPSR